MKKLIIFGIALMIVKFSFGQTIGDFFKMLPNNMVNDIPQDKREAILKGKKYYDPENDSNSIMYYHLEESNDSYLRILMAFETGQAAYVNIELRMFKTKGNKVVIVLSKAGGAHDMVWQNEIDVFEYSSKKLKISSKYTLPDTVPFSGFFKSNTPASIIEKYNQEYNFSYDLGESWIICRIMLPSYKDRDNTLKDWLQFNAIEFDWINDAFEQKKILEGTYTY